MKNFRWLHFSDLHLNPKNTNFDTAAARKRLLKHLTEEDFGDRDDALYVFITGDLIDRGEYSEEKVEWIERFTEALGVDKKRIFWSPGNHDIVRDDYRSLIIEATRGNQCTFESFISDKKRKAELYKAMDPYLTYYQKYFSRALSEEEREQCHVYYNLEDLNLIVLNTSFTSFNSKKDDGQLYVCNSHLNSVFDQVDQTKPVFVMGHHGVDFLEKEEAKN